MAALSSSSRFEWKRTTVRHSAALRGGAVADAPLRACSFAKLAPHFDMLQPMEYCSIENGTAGCAPLSWVNDSMQSYAQRGIA